MDDNLIKYRDHLVAAEQKAQEDFDKTILSLSGGALGVSFAFTKEILGKPPFKHPQFLFLAWVCWGLSVFVVLASYFASHLALRKAIKQVDGGLPKGERVGGIYDLITANLNAFGAILFSVGVLLIIVFAHSNVEVP